MNVFFSLLLWLVNLLIICGYAILLVREHFKTRNSVALRFLFLLTLYAYSVFVNLFLIVPLPIDGNSLSLFSILGDIFSYSVLIGLLFHFDRRSHNSRLAIFAKSTYTLLSVTIGFLLLSAISHSSLIVGSVVGTDGKIILVRSPLFSAFSFLSALFFIVTYYIFLLGTTISIPGRFSQQLHPRHALIGLFVLLVLSQGIFAKLGSLEPFLVAELINTIVFIVVTYPQLRFPHILYFKRFNTRILVDNGQIGWAVFKVENIIPQPLAYSTDFLTHYGFQIDVILGSAGTMMLMLQHAENPPILIFPLPSHPDFTVISIPVSLCHIPRPQQVVFTIIIPTGYVPLIEDLKNIKGGIFRHVSSLTELEHSLETGRITDLIVSVIQRVYAS